MIAQSLRTVWLAIITLVVLTSCAAPRTVAIPPVPASAKNLKLDDPSCRELITPGTHESAIVDHRSAEFAKSVARVVQDARRCAEQDQVDDEAYRDLLLASRKAIAEWYQVLPVARGAALSNDPSATQRLRSTGAEATVREEHVPSEPRLAEAYVDTQTELTRLAKKHHRSDDVLDLDLDRRDVIHAMMHVDALTTVILSQLGEQNDGRHGKPTMSPLLRERLDAFGKAVRHEAKLWATDVIPGETGMESKVPSSGSKEPISAAQRAYLVANDLYRLSKAWGRFDHGLLREYAGRPYRDALQQLQRAEQQVSTGAGNPEMSLWWVTALERQFGDKPDREVDTSAPLSRLIREVEFDEANLAGLFSMREAQAIWWGILRREGSKAGDDHAIVQASHMLIEATKRTDTARARLDGISRLVHVVDIDDGDQGQAGNTNAPSPPNPSVAKLADLRARASRQLGEVALCEMNRALFGMSPAPCRIALDPAVPPPNIPAKQCNAVPLSKDHPPDLALPGSTQEAYRRVLHALDLHWNVKPDATVTSPFLAPVASVSAQGRCELARVVNAKALARLQMRLSGYQHLLQMVADGRVRPQMQDLGPVITQALGVAEGEQWAICRRNKVQTCMLRSLVQHQAGPKDMSTYCEIVGSAKTIVDAIHRPGPTGKGGISLVKRASPHLDAVAVGAKSSGFISEAKACIAHAQANSTPATSLPPSRIGRP